MKKYIIPLLLAFTNVVLCAKPSVTVGIPPQAHIVKAIAQDTVDVTVLLKPGASPATYNPSISQLNNLEGTNAYFLMGLPFENRIISKVKKMLPGLRIIDTREGITLRYFTHAEAHHHGNDFHHSNTAVDPHVWMNTQNLEIMAKTILKELIHITPEKESIYQQNFESYCNNLHIIQDELFQITENHKDTYIAVYHPAFGYLFEPLGIHQLIIEKMGKEPSASELVELSEHILENNVQILIAQSQFSSKTAKILSNQLHIKLLTENPLEETVEDNLLSITKRAFSITNK